VSSDYLTNQQPSLQTGAVSVHIYLSRAPELGRTPVDSLLHDPVSAPAEITECRYLDSLIDPSIPA
jgi:hypothetical protein